MWVGLSLKDSVTKGKGLVKTPRDRKGLSQDELEDKWGRGMGKCEKVGQRREALAGKARRDHGGPEGRFSWAAPPCSHMSSPGMVFFLELLFLFKRSLNVLSSLSGLDTNSTVSFSGCLHIINPLCGFGNL